MSCIKQVMQSKKAAQIYEFLLKSLWNRSYSIFSSCAVTYFPVRLNIWAVYVYKKALSQIFAFVWTAKKWVGLEFSMIQSYSGVRFWADCRLSTHTLPTVRSRGGGWGRDEWVRPLPHCFWNENKGFACWYPNKHLFLSGSVSLSSFSEVWFYMTGMAADQSLTFAWMSQ